MYRNRAMVRSKVTQVRLNQPVDDLVERCAERDGVQKSVWMRNAIEVYLAQMGYELPGEGSVYQRKRA